MDIAALSERVFSVGQNHRSQRLIKAFRRCAGGQEHRFPCECRSAFCIFGTERSRQVNDDRYHLYTAAGRQWGSQDQRIHFGKDDFAIRSDIGVVFQTNLLDKLLTVKENLEVRGSFYGLSKSEWEPAFLRATQAAGVTEFLDRPYGKLSGGQKRRADIARALINTPKILFLDEPTTGLDPQTRKNVWDTIRKLQAEHGMTIFLTTHYMEEAASADYVVIIDEGEIIAEGTPDALRERYSSDVLKMRTETSSEVSRILDAHQVQYEVQKDLFRVKLAKTLDALPILEQCKTYLTYFEVVAGSMDDAFIAITGKQVQE